MSSLNPEDAVPDYSGLSKDDMKVLDDWHGFFAYVPSSVYLLRGCSTLELTYRRIEGNVIISSGRSLITPVPNRTSEIEDPTCQLDPLSLVLSLSS
jgi:hypothetical protein